MGDAGSPGPLAQQAQRLDHAGGAAGLEEVPRGRGRRRRLDHVLGCAGRHRHLGQQRAVDPRAVEVGHHHAGCQLGDLAGHAYEDGVVDALSDRPAEGDAGEVAHLHNAHVRQVGAQPESSLLRPAAGRQDDRPLPLGGGDVDLLHDRRAVRGRGERPHDPGGPEDGDTPDDPETGVARPRRHVLTARHRERDDDRAVGDLGQRGEDHAPGHRVDGGGADRETQARPGHRADARAGPKLGSSGRAR